MADNEDNESDYYISLKKALNDCKYKLDKYQTALGYAKEIYNHSRLLYVTLADLRNNFIETERLCDKSLESNNEITILFALISNYILKSPNVVPGRKNFFENFFEEFSEYKSGNARTEFKNNLIDYRDSTLKVVGDKMDDDLGYLADVNVEYEKFIDHLNWNINALNNEYSVYQRQIAEIDFNSQ